MCFIPHYQKTYQFFFFYLLSRLTVFSSFKLPITVCREENADRLYKELLGTKYMLVPFGSEERLNKWPNLEKSSPISLLGINDLISCADIVLSSAGNLL